MAKHDLPTALVIEEGEIHAKSDMCCASGGQRLPIEIVKESLVLFGSE